MKPKAMVTAALLLFVAVCVAYLVVNRRPTPEPTSEPSAAPASQPTAADSEPDPARKVVAFYFYGNVRCARCLRFEAWTREALAQHFAPQLEGGRLEWTTINVDEDANRHFIADYALATKSVVIAEFVAGERGRWRNLEKVWELSGNEREFKRYIHDAVASLLGR